MKSFKEQCKEIVKVFAGSTELETKLIDNTGRCNYSVDGVGHQTAVCSCVPKRACIESHLFGAKQAMALGGTYVFFCPLGLVHFVSPIIKEGRMVHALISGHVLMTEPDVYLVRHILNYVDDEKTIKDFVQNIRVLPPSKVKYLSELLDHLAKGLSDGSTVVNTDDSEYDLSKAKYQHSIHKVVHYIRSNYMGRLSLDSAAKLVHITPQYLSRIFREETGYTFSQYVTRIRIEKGKDLLMQEDLSQKDVALMTGFADQSHFSRSFKKVTGISPSTFQSSEKKYIL